VWAAAGYSATEEEVHLGHSRQRVSDAPRYDPELADEKDYYTDLYGYYGYAPFWGPGIYPGFPLHR